MIEKKTLKTCERVKQMENSETNFLCYNNLLKMIELLGQLNQRIFPTFGIT